MKIAVTATGETADSEVDQRFGRAKCFVIFDSESGQYTAVDNRINVEAAQGAGIQAGRIIAREGVQVLLTGHCGPKAFRVLRLAGVDVVTGVAGTVAEAVRSYLGGGLSAAEGPDREGHWS